MAHQKLIQIFRTSQPNHAPPHLEEGELSVEMRSHPPRLWVGVPYDIKPTGRIQLNDPAELGGPWLKTSGGTLTGHLVVNGAVAADYFAAERYIGASPHGLTEIVLGSDISFLTLGVPRLQISDSALTVRVPVTFQYGAVFDSGLNVTGACSISPGTANFQWSHLTASSATVNGNLTLSGGITADGASTFNGSVTSPAFVVKPSSDPPTNPVDGQLWHDSGDGHLKSYHNGNWRVMT